MLFQQGVLASPEHSAPIPQSIRQRPPERASVFGGCNAVAVEFGVGICMWNSGWFLIFQDMRRNRSAITFTAAHHDEG